MEKCRFFYGYYVSPVGLMEIVSDGSAVVRSAFVASREHEEVRHKLTMQAMQELEEYFAKKRRTFTLPLFRHAKRFSRDVVRVVSKIAIGEVQSYADVGRKCGHSNAARAVGSVCRKNPCLIFVPCHRVVRTDGGIGQYSGGAKRKRWLLQHECLMRESC